MSASNVSAIIMNSLAIAKSMYRYMLQNSLASSASMLRPGSTCGASGLKNATARRVLAGSSLPTICGISGISSRLCPSAIRSGQKARNRSRPTRKRVCPSMNRASWAVVPGDTVLRSTRSW